MKSLTKEITLEIPHRRAIVSLHRQVAELVRESNVKEGLCLVNAMHITASVFINDDESGLHHDYEVWLEKLTTVPLQLEQCQLVTVTPCVMFRLSPRKRL